MLKASLRDLGYVAALGVVTGVVAAAGIHLTGQDATAADHKEASIVRLDAAADINDVYAFTDPTDSTQLILGMTVNPFVAPPANTATFFDPAVAYRFHIDRTGDNVEDIVYEVRFGPFDSKTHQQTITVNGTAAGISTPGSIDAVAPPDVINNFTVNGAQHTIFAGLRQDPFFFDLTGFNRLIEHGDAYPRANAIDSFRDVNTSAIVLRVPISVLQGGSSTTKFGIFGTTAR